MKKKHGRLLKIGLGLVSVTVGAVLFFSAFRDHVVFYHTPQELMQNPGLKRGTLRIGGMVKRGTYEREGLKASFVLGDHIYVSYRGILPPLFREGSVAVVKGAFRGEIFHATQVLSKHDETYKPKECGG